MFVDVVSPPRPSPGDGSPRRASPPGSPTTPIRRVSIPVGIATSPNRRTSTPDRTTIHSKSKKEIKEASAKRSTLGASAATKSARGLTQGAPAAAATTGPSSQTRAAASLAAVVERSPQRNFSPPRNPEGATPSELLEEALLARRRAEEAELLLLEEQGRTAKLQHELSVETEFSARKEEKLTELTRLVQMSAGLAEQCEADRSILGLENEKNKAELERAKNKLFNMEEANARLESELTIQKCDLSTARTDASRDREEFSQKLAKLQVERDQAMFGIEELRSDIVTREKKHEATIELLHARHTAVKNGQDDELDKLRAHNEDLTTSLEDAVSNSESSQRQVQELDSSLKEQGSKFALRLSELESIHTLRVDEMDKKIRHLRSNEGTLEHHIDVLLSRATALQTTIEGQQGGFGRLRAELDSAKELNHVLAVKLKAALADKEASAMEAETRRILMNQNEEMERQLGDLRRTIADLMGRR